MTVHVLEEHLARPAVKACIYGLYDPRTDELRYVGKADDPKARLRVHICNSKTGDLPVNRWIRKLARLSLRPALRVLETVHADTWKEAERRWIAKTRKAGGRLLNVRDGGEAVETLHWARGEGVAGAKFKDADIIRMRQLRHSGMTTVELARRYNTSAGHMSRICRGDVWKHVGGPRTTDRTFAPRFVGEDHPGALLTESRVREIRVLYATDEYTQLALAHMFSVTRAAICDVVSRRSWGHVR